GTLDDRCRKAYTRRQISAHKSSKVNARRYTSFSRWSDASSWPLNASTMSFTSRSYSATVRTRNAPTFSAGGLASASFSAIQLSRPNSRATACCTSRNAGRAGGAGWARSNRARATGSPARSAFNQRLASFLRLAIDVAGVIVRGIKTFLPLAPSDVEAVVARSPLGRGRKKVRVVDRTVLGGSKLPCRGQEAPQSARWGE